MGGSEKALAMIYSREIRRILRTGKILVPVLVATKMIAANHSLWLTIFLTLLCFLCIMIIERNTLHARLFGSRRVSARCRWPKADSYKQRLRIFWDTSDAYRCL
jgi:hypothetical protein